MKHEPIKLPSTYQYVTLQKDRPLDVGFGETVLTISEGAKHVRISFISGTDWDNVPTIADWEKEYENIIKTAECVTLFINAPLKDETFELNKQDNEWYLVKMGRGFA